MKNLFQFSFVVAAAVAAFFLSACGDEVTEVNEIYQKKSAVLEDGEALDSHACTEENAGEMVFVTDSSASFVCDGDSWLTMKGDKGSDGKDGKDGDDGKDGADGDDGAKGDKGDKGDKGAKGDAGDDGEDGDDGDDGTSCTAEPNDDNSGFVLTCDGKVVGTIKNGVNGKDGEDGDDGKDGEGCKIVSDKDGVVTLACGEGRSAVSTTLYKAICGSAPYEPSTQYCSQGIVQTYGYINDSRDGQTYKTVKIGKQTWMAENLNYDPNYLPKGAKDSVILSWCYKDSAKYCEKYGRLYTWAAAMDSVAAFSDDGKGCGYSVECEPSETVRGICPEGWHLPSYDEWRKLIDAVGGKNVAGKMLKSANGWKDYKGSGNGSDAYGFSALPAGYWGGIRESYGFSGNGLEAIFYSASLGEDYSSAAYCMRLDYDSESADLFSLFRYYNCTISVRCLKD